MNPDYKRTFITAAIGIPAAVVAAIIAWSLTDGLQGMTPSTPSSSSAEVAPEPIATEATTTLPEQSSGATSETSPPDAPTLLFLKDLADDQIVKDPHWVWDSTGTASIAGTSYLNSLTYQFQNCSNCDESLEFIVPAGYTRLVGTVGLSDQSRHDDVIDGVVNFAVYDVSGNQILPTLEIEYPEAVPIDIDISGQPRIRIQMSRGTNFEQFVLGDAALERAGP